MLPFTKLEQMEFCDVTPFYNEFRETSLEGTNEVIFALAYKVQRIKMQEPLTNTIEIMLLLCNFK